jgi:alanine racemase
VTRRAVATVDPAAIAANAARLRAALTGGAGLCAVVKAGGYGHGAVTAARAALRGGASWLAVATAGEALELRAAGLTRERILVMGALSAPELAEAERACADVVTWNHAFLERVPAGMGIHVKLDTGMGRLGTRDPARATAVAEAAAAQGRLAGLMTHFATADDESDGGFFAEQLERFAAWAPALRDRLQPGAEAPILVHAANSAGTLREPAAHFDMVRAGIALYGLDPANRDAGAHGLAPALRLTSYVAAVKECLPGQSVGYGRRFVAAAPTRIATVPIGYGDGWRRGLTNNADVVIGGRRFPQVGTVSMDNVTVDLGPDGGGVRPGDEVVLIGDGITAEEVAGRLDTLNYEVTCGLTARVRREERPAAAAPQEAGAP